MSNRHVENLYPVKKIMSEMKGPEEGSLRAALATLLSFSKSGSPDKKTKIFNETRPQKEVSQNVPRVICAFHQKQIPHLSRQAQELFYMKVIRMIEKDYFLSTAEARKALSSATIRCTLNGDDTCTILCDFSPLDIQVKGTFKKDPQGTYYIFPDIQSFQIVKLV